MSPRRRTVSLVESVVALTIVSVMLVVAVRTVAASRDTLRRTENRAIAVLLAQDLLEEALRLPYEDPNAPGGPIGPETGESGSDRTAFDDVDDYDGWSAKPPQRGDGTKMTQYATWQRDVRVVWITTSAPVDEAAYDTGAKLVEVTVTDVSTGLSLVLRGVRTRGSTVMTGD